MPIYLPESPPEDRKHFGYVNMGILTIFRSTKSNYAKENMRTETSHIDRYKGRKVKIKQSDAHNW